MSNRTDEIRKRIEKRKKARYEQISSGRSTFKSKPIFLPSDEEKHGIEPFHSYENNGSEASSLFKKEFFMMKILAAVMLFLVVGILFKNSSPQLHEARQFVIQTMNTEFKFAAVSKWYEEQFGKPLALLPSPLKKEESNTLQTQVEPIYAVPASGRVLQPFSEDGQGVMIETSEKAVSAVSEGIIIYAGVKEDFGKTVVIQHADGSESWYGNLDTIDVHLYDFIENLTPLGKVAPASGQTGSYYFAIKKGDSFIDPIQVITFD